MPANGCPLWVKSRHRSASSQCPLFPQKRTLVGESWMSALCQKRTFCAAANNGRLERSTDNRESHALGNGAVTFREACRLQSLLMAAMFKLQSNEPRQ
jgi:hypothetical protein